VAFLTILELWVFIDRKVIAWMPKLKHYSPEIPVNVLEPFSFHFRSQMERPLKLKFTSNNVKCKSNGKSAIFYDTKDRDSFVSWFVGEVGFFARHSAENGT